MKNSNFTSRQIFDTFTVGESNGLAYVAAKEVAENPGNAYPILYIYGSTGLGKTHLLRAIEEQIKLEKPKTSVLYIPSEVFCNDYIDSIRDNHTMEFRCKCRNVDVLLFDDIQYIIGKSFIQEELFWTLNALIEENKQVVITADRLPEDIEGRLLSRLKSGIMIDIQSPELELRQKFLQQRADENGYAVCSSVIDYIASHTETSFFGLNGILTSIAIRAKNESRNIDISLTKDVLHRCREYIENSNTEEENKKQIRRIFEKVSALRSDFEKMEIDMKKMQVQLEELYQELQQ